ncbi:MAG: hypothetical protein WCB51_11170 [Candidatus Dormiibacterota bacterium]
MLFTGVDADDPRLNVLGTMDNVRVLNKPNHLRTIAPALSEMLDTADGRQLSGTPDIVGIRAAPGRSMSAGSS